MGDLYVAFDPNRPEGEKLGPEVAAEIAAVAPQGIDDGTVTRAKLGTDSVTHQAISPGSVRSDSLDDNAVVTDTIADGAVTGSKIADGEVTGISAGEGVVTAKNSRGSFRRLELVVLSDEDYADIGSPDDDTLYATYED